MRERALSIKKLAEIIEISTQTIKLYFDNWQLSKYVIIRGRSDWGIERSEEAIRALYEFLDKRLQYKKMDRLQNAYPFFITKDYVKTFREKKFYEV